jgi:hypothetical protein
MSVIRSPRWASVAASIFPALLVLLVDIFATMAPGHDASVLGDEPCVVIDWQGFADYAKL